MLLDAILQSCNTTHMPRVVYSAASHETARHQLGFTLCTGELKTLTDAELAELNGHLVAAERAAAKARSIADCAMLRFAAPKR